MSVPTNWPMGSGKNPPICVDCGKMQPQRQRVAFTAVVHEGGAFIIGRADEGEQGYTPLPGFGKFKDFETAQERAEDLNKAVGLGPKTAAIIVGRTMLKGGFERTDARQKDLLRRAMTTLKGLPEEDRIDLGFDDLVEEIEEELED